MPAGDITKAIVAKARTIANESSAGFWSDTNLYQYVDSAQKFAITFGLEKQKGLQQLDKYKELEFLKPALKSTDITLATGSNTISLSTVTDITELYKMALYNHTDLVLLYLNYISLNQLIMESQNSYGGHSYDSTSHKGNVFGAYYQGTIVTSFTTLPYTYLDRLKIYYYGTPTTLDASHDPILLSYTFDALIELTLWYAYEQKTDYEKAGVHFKQALQLLNNLQ